MATACERTLGPEEFVQALGTALPTANLSALSDRIDSSGPLDLARRYFVRQAIAGLVGMQQQGVPATLHTVGDAFEWYSQMGGPPSQGGEIERRNDVADVGTTLRPLEPGDIPILYRAALEPGQSFRWRFRGATPSSQQFSDALYRGTLAQFAVTESATGSLHGLVVLYNAMPESGHAYIGFQRVSRENNREGQMMAGIVKLIEHAFKNWPFRKLYAELPDYNYEGILGSLGSPVECEGRLRGHMFYDGVYHDMYLVAIYREAWELFIEPWRHPVTSMKRALGGSSR